MHKANPAEALGSLVTAQMARCSSPCYPLHLSLPTADTATRYPCQRCVLHLRHRGRRVHRLTTGQNAEEGEHNNNDSNLTYQLVEQNCVHVNDLQGNESLSHWDPTASESGRRVYPSMNNKMFYDCIIIDVVLIIEFITYNLLPESSPKLIVF